MARVRSPNYPALSLPDAIGKTQEVYSKQQMTAEPREVIIKHMGYGSVNGRALKALSALIKYGLLEEAGKGLRVSGRAKAILFPDPSNPSAKADAISAAAAEPDLYARILAEKGRKPSADSLKHFLIHEGFNMSAVDSVARAFYETFALVDGQGAAYDSSEIGDDEEDNEMEGAVQPPPPGKVPPGGKPPPAPPATLNSTKPVFDFETVAINTKIDNQEDLAELIARLEQIKAMLPNKTEH
jgi:hypothetical protein